MKAGSLNVLQELGKGSPSAKRDTRHGRNLRVGFLSGKGGKRWEREFLTAGSLNVLQALGKGSPSANRDTRQLGQFKR